MAYEPTNWKTGDVVTSSKLNKLEMGLAISVNILTITEVSEGNYSVPMQFSNIVEVMEMGGIIIFEFNGTCAFGVYDSNQNSVYAKFIDIRSGTLIRTMMIMDETGIEMDGSVYSLNSSASEPVSN